ncbi:MAG: hypothetical protein V2I27_00200 [Erythrobacter sp.]|jgi:hypothetical protein|nr:hypothetical protein [Erythrobacter sp.]
MTREFDHFLAIDWSGARGERHRGIALAFATKEGEAPTLVRPPEGGWSRVEVLALLRDELPPNTLVGVDLGISLPFQDAGAFFPGWERTPRSAKKLWALIDELCADDPHLGAHGFLADRAAARYFRHGKDHVGDLFLPADAITREGRFRVAEIAQRAQGCRPVSNFNLVGAAQVGKSSLTGMRMLHALRGHLPVWPVDPIPERRRMSGGSVLVEIYTALAAKEAAALRGEGRGARTKLLTYADLNDALRALGSAAIDEVGTIDDHSSDALLTAAWLRRAARQEPRWSPRFLTAEIAWTEGWTFGAL